MRATLALSFFDVLLALYDPYGGLMLLGTSSHDMPYIHLYTAQGRSRASLGVTRAPLVHSPAHASACGGFPGRAAAGCPGLPAAGPYSTRREDGGRRGTYVRANGVSLAGKQAKRVKWMGELSAQRSFLPFPQQPQGPDERATTSSSAAQPFDSYNNEAFLRFDRQLARKRGGKYRKYCKGPTCLAMSNLLPNLTYAAGASVVTCSCADFSSGKCFAPGCAVCDRACFNGNKELLKNPGPFGTGLLCSSGCQPCCQPAPTNNGKCLLAAGCF